MFIVFYNIIKEIPSQDYDCIWLFSLKNVF